MCLSLGQRLDAICWRRARQKNRRAARKRRAAMTTAMIVPAIAAAERVGLEEGRVLEVVVAVCVAMALAKVAVVIMAVDVSMSSFKEGISGSIG